MLLQPRFVQKSPYIMRFLSTDSGSRGQSRLSSWGRSGRSAVDLGALRAALGDVTDFTASVASLSTLVVDWTTVGSSAVARDVTELAAGVAFHGLSLAVAGEVVGTTALVACSSTRHAGVATAVPAETTTEAATRSRVLGWSSRGSRTIGGSSAVGIGWAVAGKVADLVASVATTVGGTA